MKFSRILLILLLASAMVFTLLSCTDGKKLLGSSKEDKTVVMKIDGHDVPLEIYRYVVMNLKADMDGGDGALWEGETGEALLTELYSRAEDMIKRLYATSLLCSEYGIDPEDEYFTYLVDDEMNKLYASYNEDWAKIAQAYDANYLTDDVYRFIIKDDLLSVELLNKLTDSGEIVTDINEVEKIIRSDEFIRVKQVLITPEEGESDESARLRAEDVRQSAVDGADFDRLVELHGKDLFMFSNTDGYYLCHGAYDEAFTGAAFDLEIGEVSPVVKTSAGYSVLMRLEKEDKYIEKHLTDLCETYISASYSLRVEEFYSSLTVDRTEECAKYTPFNMK